HRACAIRLGPGLPRRGTDPRADPHTVEAGRWTRGASRYIRAHRPRGWYDLHRLPRHHRHAARDGRGVLAVPRDAEYLRARLVAGGAYGPRRCRRCVADRLEYLWWNAAWAGRRRLHRGPA